MAGEANRDLVDRLARTALGLCEHAAECDWCGPDAYDGLWHPWPEWLRGGRRRRQVLAQVHVRSPLDVRRLYRRRHPRISKGVALFAHAAVRLHAREADQRALTLASRALDTLEADRSAGEDAWGYPFDMQTRWSFYPANSANIIATSFAAAALYEAAQTLQVERYGLRAERAARWVAEQLYDEERGIFVYYPGGNTLIHNANLLGARLVWKVLGERDLAERAAERTLEAQRPDGSFPYGDGVEFVDSFHTGYVLECLAGLADIDPRVREALEKGVGYYVERFFGPDGETPLWPDRPFPQDAHAAGTGLSALATLTGEGYVSAAVVAKVASWSLARMMRGGRTVFRRYRYGSTRVRYLRWTDGHMALGMASAGLQLAVSEPSRSEPSSQLT